MVATPDEDEDFDFGISLAAIGTVIDHARAVQGMAEDEDDYSDDDEGEPGDDDLDEESLAAFIDELNEDEQSALIALAWIGRGDHDAEEWDEAKRLAAERNLGRNTAAYLLGLENVGDLIAEGLAAFGVSEEEIER
jgi:hypothetical protein